ncbi:MAG: regulator [Betaproteobacteria bacterium]|nr:regulator [Betaproteobacteria bacterium]MDH5219739.1 regulator [Betaproteobacteria bacterium]MDH5350486.1 regulator [Betaproteobacteria bacterium]
MKRRIVLGALALAAAVLAAIAWLAARPGQGAPEASNAPPAATPPVPAQAKATRPEERPPAAASGKSAAAVKRPAASGAQPAPAARPAEGAAGDDPAAGRKVTHFRVGERSIKRIMADGDRIWLATSGGVIRYDTAQDAYRLYDARSGLRGETVLFVGRLGKRIAAGVQRGGLALLDAASERWETIDKAQGLAEDSVADAMLASNGDVWIATAAGVHRVRGGALQDRSRWDLYTSQSTARELPSDRAYGLAEGPGGDIWIATEGGAARFRDGNWRTWPHAGGAMESARPAAGHVTVAIAVDRDGTVWAGSLGGGVSRFDGRQWRRWSRADGLPGDHVFVLHLDAQGRIWLGTDGGLARVNGARFDVLTTREGLFSNTVFAMASTPQALWVGGYGGLARLRGVN